MIAIPMVPTQSYSIVKRTTSEDRGDLPAKPSYAQDLNPMEVHHD